MRPPTRTREQLLAEVARQTWVHTIDLGGGAFTPGRWGKLNPCILRAFDSIDFHGKTVLDIGCWDGYYSFEAEKRGAARVFATDLITQRKSAECPTFELAKELRGSKAEYFPQTSVYDVESLGVRDFDVVIYTGVYYHLKDPLRSFAKLRRVMKEGATIIVEGAVIDAPECYAKFYYRDPYVTDYSNWWVPTIPCLRQWVECNFLAPQHEFGTWDAGRGNLRFALTASAVSRADARYIRPDEDLRAFDQNVYPDLPQRRVVKH